MNVRGMVSHYIWLSHRRGSERLCALPQLADEQNLHFVGCFESAFSFRFEQLVSRLGSRTSMIFVPKAGNSNRSATHAARS